MVRLAEYLADLATLFGEYKSVHFVRLASGTTQVVQAVEYEAEPKIRERVTAVRNQDGPIDAMRAARAINQRLAEDNASGTILDPTRAQIIEFPGRKRFTEPRFGPFNQPGNIDGVPIRIGGESDPVPVHLEEPGQEAHICQASRAIAREIAPYLFSSMLRAEGVGRWHRDGDGKWIMDRFTIQGFKVLKELSLSDTVARLRAIPSGLHKIEDPLAEVHRIRHGDEAG